jgi:hypothetical protein
MQALMTRLPSTLLALLLAVALVASMAAVAGAQESLGANSDATASATPPSTTAQTVEADESDVDDLSRDRSAPDKSPLIIYHLEDVAFDDGGTADGSFTFDTTMECPSACPDAYRDIRIVTSGGDVLAGTDYLDRVPAGASDAQVLEVGAEGSASDLLLAFADPLGSALVVELTPGGSYESSEDGQRTIVSGRVIGVRPVPVTTTSTTTTLPALTPAPPTPTPAPPPTPAPAPAVTVPSVAPAAVAPSTTTTTAPRTVAPVPPSTTTTTTTTTLPPNPAPDPVAVPDVTIVTPSYDDTAEPPSGRRTEPLVKVPRVQVVRDITFPIVGPVGYYAGFGACRDGCRREHHGVDLMTYGWKGLPVVAAHDGVVTKINPDVGNGGCAVRIDGDDGWQTRYLHMNNDLPGTDNALGGFAHCIVPDLAVGERVEEGQLIGWVGDSGNAEGTAPHVHFEIRTPNGLPIDPYESLKQSRRITISRIDGRSPAQLATRVAERAYPNGATVVYLTSAVDVDPWFSSGVSSGRLDGPLLVTAEDSLTNTTRTELERLAPDRIVVVGDRISTAVEKELVGLARSVERVMVPLPVPTVSSDGIERPEANVGNRVAPFSVLILDTVTSTEPEEPALPADAALKVSDVAGAVDGSESAVAEGLGEVEAGPGDPNVADAGADRLRSQIQSLIESVPTLMLRVEASGSDEEPEPFGRSPYEVPKNPVRSGPLYHATEAGYVQKSAALPVRVGYEADRAREGEPIPNGGVIVIPDSDNLGATVTFVESLVNAPAMPLWR